MPNKNMGKISMPNSYYHVYARSADKQPVFNDSIDCEFFLSLFKRYLSETADRNPWIRTYTKLYDSVELLAYCLVGNHFHLLLHQVEDDGVARLLRGVMPSYRRYFNKKYGRSGRLFDTHYKNVPISESYILPVSSYIHLDPTGWVQYPYSSLRAYLYDDAPTWLSKKQITKVYRSASKYLEFLNSQQQGELLSVNLEFADSIDK